MKSRPKKSGKRRYITARDVPADIPPPDFARKLIVGAKRGGRVDVQKHAISSRLRDPKLPDFPDKLGPAFTKGPKPVRQVENKAAEASVLKTRKRAITGLRKYRGSLPAGAVRLVRAERERRTDGPLRRSSYNSSRLRSLLRGYSDHRQIDARSLAMHCLVARKLLANPALINHARNTLARWKAQAAEPMPNYIVEWEAILEESPEAIAGFLASMREDATRLRQSSPFSALLTSAERSRIYRAFL